MYRDKAGEWRWKLQAVNGETVAVSSEGYKRAIDCRAAIKLVAGVDELAMVDISDGHLVQTSQVRVLR